MLSETLSLAQPLSPAINGAGAPVAACDILVASRFHILSPLVPVAQS